MICTVPAVTLSYTKCGGKSFLQGMGTSAAAVVFRFYNEFAPTNGACSIQRVNTAGTLYYRGGEAII